MQNATWILALISLIGTVFNIRKRVICFYIWLIGDVCRFIFDYVNGAYGRAMLDFVQVLLAFCGIIEWRREVRF